MIPGPARDTAAQLQMTMALAIIHMHLQTCKHDWACAGKKHPLLLLAPVRGLHMAKG